MIARLTTTAILAAVVCACGGTPAPGATQPPTGATPSPAGQPTPAGPPVEGESIDSAGVAAAVTALQALDSWTFEVTYILAGLETGIQRSVTGTERRDPDVAVDAMHEQPDGTDFRYIRIGDDIWTDVATGEFFHTAAAGAENLIDQYEPFYITALAEEAEGARFDFEPVGEEPINGVNALHYRLSQGDRENIVQLTDLTADQWAGDVWIARDGGYLVGLAWGPQTIETAQPIMGFRYEVTSVNCACPIEPPA